MSRVLAIARAVFLDSIRRRVLLVVLVFAAIMVALIPALPDYGLGVEAAVYGEISLAVTFATALVVVIGLAVTRIPSEVDRRTLYSVLARPVARWEYLAGTWLGTFMTAAMLVAAFTVIDQLVALRTYGEPMWLLWLGAAGILLELGVIAAFAHAVSTAVSPITTIVASIAFIFLGHSRATLLGEEGALALRAFYPSLDAFNVVAPVTHGSGVPPVYLLSMIVVFVGFVGLLLLIGTLLFRGRDI
ncbi:MAG: hypothetical protein ACYC77_06625 [Coriobacteriia bacterium]